MNWKMKCRLVGVLVGMFALSTPIVGQETTDQETTEMIGDWGLLEAQDPWTDAKITAIVLANTGTGISRSIGGCAITCRGNNLQVMILHSYMAGSTNNQVRHKLRIAGGEVVNRNAELAGNHEASYLSVSPDLVVHLAENPRIAIQVTDLLDGEVLTFTKRNIKGTSEALTRLPCLNPRK